VENRRSDGTRAAMNKQRIILFSMGTVLKNIRGTFFFPNKKIIAAVKTAESVLIWCQYNGNRSLVSLML